MGRHNGSWAKFHPQMNDHAKTKAAIAVLVAAGVPAEFAGPLVVSAVPRLAAWALSDGDTGRTGSLSDARFATEAWPESVESKRFGRPTIAGALIRKALHAVPVGHDSGYLEGDAEEERIHGFADIYYDVLKNRRDARGSRERRGAGSDTPTTTTTATPSATPNARGNATVPGGSGSGSGSVATAEAEASGSGSERPPPALQSQPDPAGQKPEARNRRGTRAEHAPPERGYAPTDRLRVAPASPAQGDGVTPEIVALAASLAVRIGGPSHPLVESMLAELATEGMDPAWLRAKVDATPQGSQRPFTWARTIREAWAEEHPGTSLDAERERLRHARDARRWAEKASTLDEEAAAIEASSGAPTSAEEGLACEKRKAAKSWRAQAEDAARRAGIDPGSLRSGTVVPS